VRQRPGEERENIEQFQQNEITTWCCVSQGKSGIKTLIEKNTFVADDVVRAKVVVY
jgi:hypothetical protein